MTDAASYSVKEMLNSLDDRVRVGFERLDAKLDAKASQIQVDKIEARVEVHEIALQRQDAAKAIMRASRAQILSIIGAAIGVVGVASRFVK